MKTDASITSKRLNAALTEWAIADSSITPAKPSQSFIAKAQRAARKAEALRKLSRQERQTGFKPLPLPDYLIDLARAAHVSLGVLLPAAVQNGSPQATPWIALARAAAIPSDVIRLLTRVWVAVHHSELDPEPILARQSPLDISRNHRTLSSATSKAQVETALIALERNYPPELRRILEQALAETK